MSELYLTRMEAVHEGPISYWRAPGGDPEGFLELRNHDQRAADPAVALPSGFVLALYDGPRVHPNLALNLGNVFDAQMSPIAKSGLETLLGISIAETRIDRIVREIVLAHGDATGVTGHKPLRINRRTGFNLTLGRWAISERFSEAHPAFQTTLDVFRADYRRNLAGGAPLELLRKMTGTEMQKLYGRMGDDLLGILPPERSRDGWAVPTTTIGDTFVEASDTNLESHTATGPNGGFSWTKQSGTGMKVQASSNTLIENIISGGTFNRANSALSGDAMYCQVDWIANISQVNRQFGVLTRVQNDAQTDGYVGVVHHNGTNATWRIYSVTNFSLTQLGADLGTGSFPSTSIRLESSASDVHDFIVDSVSKGTRSDSTHTGFVRGGIYCTDENTGGVEVDNFEAADLAAGGSIVPIVMQVM